MKYIFDNHSLQYMLEQFPRQLAPEVWDVFCANCDNGIIISEKETQKKLQNEANESETLEWCKSHTSLFKAIGLKESIYLSSLMSDREFDFLNTREFVERRLPEGLPFILCIAKENNRYFVYRKNTQKEIIQRILTVCDKHTIQYLEVEEFLMQCRKNQE